MDALVIRDAYFCGLVQGAALIFDTAELTDACGCVLLRNAYEVLLDVVVVMSQVFLDVAQVLVERCLEVLQTLAICNGGQGLSSSRLLLLRKLCTAGTVEPCSAPASHSWVLER